MQNFRAYVSEARVTDDPAGDLIADAKTDRRMPETFPTRERLETYLCLRGACQEAMDAAPVVWRRYQGWLKRHAGTVAILLLVSTAALAQTGKADRMPTADPDAPRVVRTIPIVRNGFDDRWFGPAASDRWLSNQPPSSDRFAPEAVRQQAVTQNTPTGLPAAVGIVPVAGNRLRHDPITATPRPRPRPVQVADVCTRHGKTKVFTGKYQWRCK